MTLAIMTAPWISSRLLPPPVCLSVCMSDYSQTCERILTKFFGGVGHGSRTKWYNFGGDPDHASDPGVQSPKSGSSGSAEVCALWVLLVVIIIISASLSINIASISTYLTDLSPSPSVNLCVCRSICLSVCQSVWKVYCGKMADWIQMSFVMVSGVGQGIGGLDGDGGCRRERGSFGGEFRASHCNQWELCCIVVRELCAHPKWLWEDLLLLLLPLPAKKLAGNKVS